jgi:uncharacterized Rmd1/YagE family protein
VAPSSTPVVRSIHAIKRDTLSRCTQRRNGRSLYFDRCLVTLPKPPQIQQVSDINDQITNTDSDHSSACKGISSSLEQELSRVVHTTTSDFFPPPSLQEDLHVASTNSDMPSSTMSSYLAPRIIKIQRKDVPSTEQLETLATPTEYRQSLSGYKYKVMKTPQSTNEILSSQVPHDPNPAINHLEGNEYNHYFNQDNSPSPSSLGLQQTITDGINGDILSSHWWRTLYQNVVHPSTSRSAPTNSHPFQSASMRNRRASILLEEIINNSQQQFQEEEDEKITARIRVRSVQAASSIDVVAVLSKVFGGGVARTQQYDVDEIEGANNDKLSSITNNNPLSEFFASSPPLRHVFGRTNIIIQLSPPPADCPTSLAPSVPRYVAIYRFGSVVFFNVTTKEASKLLEQIKKHSLDPIAVGFERREFFEMGIQPQLETASGVISADRAIVRELDMNTVGVVSNIMGQTVALDWHNDTVDELLASFSNINTSVERTGNFSSMERHMLFQVVARNNSLFIDMVSKLGIKDRSDTAWHLSQYEGEKCIEITYLPFRCRLIHPIQL